VMVSCAERAVPPANVASPSHVPPKAAPSLHPKVTGARRRAAVIMDDANKRLATRARQIVASARTERRPEARSSKSQPSQVPREPWRNIPSTAARPSHLEPAESNVPVAALLPPPPEPAEPTFPSAPHQDGSSLAPAPISHLAPGTPVEAAISPLLNLAPASEPPTVSIAGASHEVTMPPLPEPAEPSFPTAAQIPPPREPAEPVLLDQEPIVIEIPFPEIAENLSLRVRSDWRDVAETFSIPPGLLPEAFELTQQRRVPSLVRDPWPLPPKG
jgi:hypothetical protein